VEVCRKAYFELGHIRFKIAEIDFARVRIRATKFLGALGIVGPVPRVPDVISLPYCNGKRTICTKTHMSVEPARSATDEPNAVRIEIAMPVATPLEPADVTRIVPVVAHAVAVFGDEHKTTHWLSTPLALLDNKTPAEVLQTQAGIARVEQILVRIEHNIPS
jgi:Antitoxin Xre/MbcA/ParS C-terminal toxin-binding domain